MNKQELMETLDLPESRADRTLHLREKLEEGTITKTEFLELCANTLVRREMIANPDVSNYGVTPYFGLVTSAKDGQDKGPSINDMLRAQFETVNNKEDVIEVSNKAVEEGKIFVSSNIVLFHADDVTVDEDAENPRSSFEITPQTASSSEEEESEEPPSTDEVDVESVFG